jgi:mannose-1-phosphate guanylyltransferase
VGGWRSLQAVCRHDKQNNVLFGKTLVVNSSGNVVRAGKRLVALVGLRDHVVVDTEDATLVCALDQTEAIREIVRQLKQRKWTRYL